jgi:hypothetical protein
LESIKSILGSLGCLTFIFVIGYAILENRLLELGIIYLSVFGIIWILNNIVIERFSEKKQQQITSYFSRNLILSLILIVSVILIPFFFGNRVIDGLTSVDTLTEKLHEQSKYKYSGSKCNDGWNSLSQGSGTCSWHGGVAYEFHAGQYTKSIIECKREASKLSWLD